MLHLVRGDMVASLAAPEPEGEWQPGERRLSDGEWQPGERRLSDGEGLPGSEVGPGPEPDEYMLILPLSGSSRARINLTRVLFPDPVSPSIAVEDPGRKS